MTDQFSPITPPPELVKKWYQEADNQLGPYYDYIATQAARWGADQELEACCEYIAGPGRWFVTPQSRLAELRAARRPKPPSLAEEALAALNEIEDRYAGPSTQEILVRRALERLQELENND